MKKRSFKIMFLWTKRAIIGKKARVSKNSRFSFTTTYPDDVIEFNEWTKMYNVSILFKK